MLCLFWVGVFVCCVCVVMHLCSGVEFMGGIAGVVVVVVLAWCDGVLAGVGSLYMWCSYLCGGMMCAGSVRSWSMTSRAVSDAAQKNGGDSLHPICKAVGMTNSVWSIGVFLSGEGNT